MLQKTYINIPAHYVFDVNCKVKLGVVYQFFDVFILKFFIIKFHVKFSKKNLLLTKQYHFGNSHKFYYYRLISFHIKVPYTN